MDSMDCLPHMEFFASKGLNLLSIRCDPAVASATENEKARTKRGEKGPVVELQRIELFSPLKRSILLEQNLTSIHGLTTETPEERYSTVASSPEVASQAQHSDVSTHHWDHLIFPPPGSLIAERFDLFLRKRLRAVFPDRCGSQSRNSRRPRRLRQAPCDLQRFHLEHAASDETSSTKTFSAKGIPASGSPQKLSSV